MHALRCLSLDIIMVIFVLDDDDDTTNYFTLCACMPGNNMNDTHNPSSFADTSVVIGKSCMHND